ncbi:phage holin [Viridibacillus arvi]|uniref:Holin n=1 Tax=Viridibacillus arvi TaxID=263475 RepID=A0A0M0LLS2_9BACL|nr:phage holin [Viridibacillus arvi]KOO52015.1 holin [Viridibacillus arvi]
MRINWKIRFKNPQFWFHMFLAVASSIGGYLGITGEDVSTWPKLYDVLLQAISNPFVLFTVIVAVYNSVIDPTTSGISDSKQALRYTKVKCDEK